MAIERQDSYLSNLRNEWIEMFQTTLPAAATSKSPSQVNTPTIVVCSSLLDQGLSNILAAQMASAY
jgi:hypothetical protein